MTEKWKSPARFGWYFDTGRGSPHKLTCVVSFVPLSRALTGSSRCEVGMLTGRLPSFRVLALGFRPICGIGQHRWVLVTWLTESAWTLWHSAWPQLAQREYVFDEFALRYGPLDRVRHGQAFRLSNRDSSIPGNVARISSAALATLTSETKSRAVNMDLDFHARRAMLASVTRADLEMLAVYQDYLPQESVPTAPIDLPGTHYHDCCYIASLRCWP